MVIAVVSPTPPGHCGKIARDGGERAQFLGAGRVADDGGAEALKVVAVVEVVDQHVVRLDLPAETGATTIA